MVNSDVLVQYPFTPRFLDVKGNRLAYLDEGTGPVIVCVHGNPTWSYMYRQVVSDFSSHYRVIAMDHLGCGFSDKPQDFAYTLENHIANLQYLLDSLEIKQCTLMVHDWGGAIGMGWAVEHVSQVQGIVVFNTAAFRSRRMPLRIALCRIPVLGSLLVRGLNGFARAALFMAVAKPMEKKVAAGFLAPYDSWKNRKAILEFVHDIPLNPEHRSYAVLQSIESGLEKLASVPMLICWGGKDFCFTDHFYREWKQRFPNAVAHYFPLAGHYILEDSYSEIYSLLHRFLADIHGKTTD